jgi:YVTN family beta-propeller protein
MKVNHRLATRASLLVAAALVTTLASARLQAQSTGTCGGQNVTLPFTDVPAGNIFFCSIASAYFSGLTSGTSATTYSPSGNVSREQMAAFVTRTQDSALRRGSRRAALGQWWTPKSIAGLNLETTPLSCSPFKVRSDGADLWVASDNCGGLVNRVRASDGKLLETWTGPGGIADLLIAMGRVFVTGNSSLYMIDPNSPPGALTPVTTNPPMTEANRIAFDGAQLWITSFSEGTISLVTPSASFPWTRTTLTGFTTLGNITYDGANMWVTNFTGASIELVKIVPPGIIAARVPVGNGAGGIIFDGTNIWVTNFFENTVTVIRASTASVLATLSGNGLDGPSSLAFDGERILAVNKTGKSVSLWKATDLSPLGSVIISETETLGGACSDGLNFWITLSESPGGINHLLRF